MYNALKTTAVAALLGIVAVSCGGNKRAAQADALLATADSLVAARDYPAAIQTLDTLDVKYRDCLDQRKRGTQVRLRALADLTRDSLASAEAQLHVVAPEVEEMQKRFRFVEMPGTDGYYVLADSYTGREMNTTSLQARVDPQGYFFLIANVAGRSIGLNRITVGSASTAQFESVDVEGSDIASLTQETAAPVVEALLSASAPVTAELIGRKSSVKVKLDAKALSAISATWQYAQSLQKSRKLNIQLEKLERQLAKLNDQLAATLPDE